MPCVKSGARAGSLYRNLVAHALTLGASGDRAPVRQQPWGARRTAGSRPRSSLFHSLQALTCLRSSAKDASAEKRGLCVIFSVVKYVKNCFIP